MTEQISSQQRIADLQAEIVSIDAQIQAAGLAGDAPRTEALNTYRTGLEMQIDALVGLAQLDEQEGQA